MKTAEEWLTEYREQKPGNAPTVYFHDGSLIRAIQQEAVRHGMTLAAEEGWKAIDPSCEGTARRCAEEMKFAIITARDNFQLP